MPGLRLIALVLGAAYTALLLLFTLSPVAQLYVGSEAQRGVLTWRSWMDPQTWAAGTLTEFGANIAIFVPWGVLALVAVGVRRWWLAAAGGVVLTWVIEVAQIPLARISDPRDLVANTAGAVLGVGLAALVSTVVARSARRRSAVRPAGARPAQG
ncbi:VanZ family protein [Microcella flavibacter]|uniref:VanZ family protein n=1 Tax=Microcella flavibacter TaxID=1804990 RepID=UPI0014572CD0|nr:VanZ family protein [Microcella flavibacter]